jgi:hypothetical protein
MSLRLLAAGLLCGLVFLVGCGSGNWGTVSGTVTQDQTPLEDGIITFHPVDGTGSSGYGQIIKGAYEISTGAKTGLPVGSYKVTVSASTIPKEGTSETAKLLTPKKYSQPHTTDLKAEVKSGSNQIPFAMSSK